MDVTQRLTALQQSLKAADNDEVRYGIGEKVRALGYLDFADFCAANPPVEHVEAVEQVLLNIRR